jgi:hypothetical protein
MDDITTTAYRARHQGVNEGGVGCRARHEPSGFTFECGDYARYSSNRKAAVEGLLHLLPKRLPDLEPSPESDGHPEHSGSDDEAGTGLVDDLGLAPAWVEELAAAYAQSLPVNVMQLSPVAQALITLGARRQVLALALAEVDQRLSALGSVSDAE